MARNPILPLNSVFDYIILSPILITAVVIDYSCDTYDYFKNKYNSIFHSKNDANEREVINL